MTCVVGLVILLLIHKQLMITEYPTKAQVRKGKEIRIRKALLERDYPEIAKEDLNRIINFMARNDSKSRDHLLEVFERYFTKGLPDILQKRSKFQRKRIRRNSRRILGVMLNPMFRMMYPDLKITATLLKEYLQDIKESHQ